MDIILEEKARITILCSVPVIRLTIYGDEVFLFILSISIEDLVFQYPERGKRNSFNVHLFLCGKYMLSKKRFLKHLVNGSRNWRNLFSIKWYSFLRQKTIDWRENLYHISTNRYVSIVDGLTQMYVTYANWFFSWIVEMLPMIRKDKSLRKHHILNIIRTNPRMEIFFLLRSIFACPRNKTNVNWPRLVSFQFNFNHDFIEITVKEISWSTCLVAVNE